MGIYRQEEGSNSTAYIQSIGGRAYIYIAFPRGIAETTKSEQVGH